jgi:phospholipase/lecithinase/hemolysin
MIFSSQAPTRNAPRPPSSWLARLSRAVVTLATFGLLASCGGETSQLEAFVPLRYFALGDETSLLTSTGRNFSVNGVDANGNVDCTVQPIWVQQVAAIYGFGFAECQGNSSFDTRARILATQGAKVEDVTAQVEAQVAAGGFRDRDLATVLAGANDILELYALYPALSREVLIDQAKVRGKQLAQGTVNRLIELGVKVVVSDVPDMGLTPFAIAERALATDIDRAQLLSDLTTAFNEQLGVNVVLDGRWVGLAQTQLRFQAIGRSPGSFGLGNISQGICTELLPDCTTSTLVPDVPLSSYLWADATHLAPTGQAQLASLAIDRARRNPF